MIVIRDYVESRDAPAVGRLISDTFSAYNLDFAPAEELPLFLGPFQHAYSSDSARQAAIAEVLRAPLVLVAQDQGQIVGVLRGSSERLKSLFVHGDHHRRGIGRRLVTRFEACCLEHGAAKIKVAATLYAVPFYHRLGYKRSTGVRCGWCFEGSGLPYQPMKKMLRESAHSQRATWSSGKTRVAREQDASESNGNRRRDQSRDETVSARGV